MGEKSEGTSNNASINALQKEWDEVSCPICLNHPHNAVLLFCSSHEKGCRSYICDTSYRHSNCLDQFKKSCVNLKDITNLPGSSLQDNSTIEPNDNTIHQSLVPVHFLTSSSMASNSIGNQEILNHAASSESILIETSQSNEEISNNPQDGIAPTSVNEIASKLPDSLKCPLCRGTVSGWMIVKEVRQYLNLKPRSCSCESCLFFGNYMELRRHARRVHPSTRPIGVDPSRQRAWRRLEHQREHGDILSAIRSAMPGAVVLGDYAIDNGDDPSLERGFGGVDEPLWSTLLLFHMISRRQFGSPSDPSRLHRGSYGLRNMWHANPLSLRDDEDEDFSLDDDDALIPRRRRRFASSRHDEECQ